MTTIVLTRHGETTYNDKGLQQGHIDAPLNDTGREQAKQLSDALLEQYDDVSSVYASDLQRSYDTAEAIAAVYDRDVEQVPAFRERDYGVFNDEPTADMLDHLEDIGYPDDWCPEGGESISDVRDRAYPELQTIAEQHDDTVVIVGHATLNRTLLSTIRDIDDPYDIDQNNCCINELRYDTDEWQVTRMNDAPDSHN